MGCSAHNHPPSCNCGWGGVHYEAISPEYGLDYWAHASSHTNPNARCPVCGASVFFYRSPEGGAVYFDSLGPPWPKHPCLDEGSEPRPRDKLAIHSDGWWPFLADFMGPLPSGEGYLVSDAQGRMLLVKSKYYLSLGTPIWITAVPGHKGVYRFSTLMTRKGKTSEAIYDAYSLEAFTNPEHFGQFPRSIAFLNQRLRGSR